MGVNVRDENALVIARVHLKAHPAENPRPHILFLETHRWVSWLRLAGLRRANSASEALAVDLNFIRRDFKPLLAKAELPEVALHSLRHSSNSFLIEEGADPLLVAKRNGHSSTRMVLDRHGHLSEGARRQAAQTMDRVFVKGPLVVKWSSSRPTPANKRKRRFQKAF